MEYHTPGAFVRNMLAVLARAADGPGASGQTTQAASLVRFWQRRLAQIATVYWYCRVKSTSSKFESDLSGPNAVTRRTEAAVTVAALAVPKVLPVPAWPALTSVAQPYSMGANRPPSKGVAYRLGSSIIKTASPPKKTYSGIY